MKVLLLVYVLFINIVSFVIYGMDKWKAQRGKRRVSEKTLLILAGIGGSIGAYGGMMFFRHKTKKVKFYVGVPAIIIIQIVMILFSLRVF